MCLYVCESTVHPCSVLSLTRPLRTIAGYRRLDEVTMNGRIEWQAAYPSLYLSTSTLSIYHWNLPTKCTAVSVLSISIYLPVDSNGSTGEICLSVPEYSESAPTKSLSWNFEAASSKGLFRYLWRRPGLWKPCRGTFSSAFRDSQCGVAIISHGARAPGRPWVGETDTRANIRRTFKRPPSCRGCAFRIESSYRIEKS